MIKSSVTLLFSVVLVTLYSVEAQTACAGRISLFPPPKSQAVKFGSCTTMIPASYALSVTQVSAFDIGMVFWEDMDNKAPDISAA